MRDTGGLPSYCHYTSPKLFPEAIVPAKECWRFARHQFRMRSIVSSGVDPTSPLIVRKGAVIIGGAGTTCVTTRCPASSILPPLGRPLGNPVEHLPAVEEFGETLGIIGEGGPRDVFADLDCEHHRKVLDVEVEGAD
jgi:hypothetical protein